MTYRNLLRIWNTDNRYSLPERSIRRAVAALYTNEGIQPSQIVNLICCSDYTIRQLNRRYRHIDKPTDVLSFLFNERDLLGEIYISLRRTEVQAHRFHVTFEDELIRLFVHGLLHLAGHDHHRASDKMKMEKAEKYYLNQINAGYTFSDKAGRRPKIKSAI